MEQSIGTRLREIRAWRGLSLRATAQLAGLSASYLSMIERGERQVERRATLEALAAALRVAPSELGSVFPGSYRDPAVAAARASVGDVEDALTDIDLDDRPGRPAAPWPEITARLGELARLRPLGDYATQGTLLPDLIADLHVALPEHRQAALEGLCSCYQAAAQMARSLGVRGMPHMAALRLRHAAEELDDPAWLGLGAYITARASGRARSIVVADRGVAELAPHLDDRRCREMAGQLHLVASLAETVLGHPDRGEDRIAEAVDLARTVPDGELGFAGLMFGPTNAAAWRVSSAMERDPGTAGARPDRRPAPQRRRGRTSRAPGRGGVGVMGDRQAAGPVVEFLAREGRTARLLAEHVPDATGHCVVCSEGGQAGRSTWRARSPPRLAPRCRWPGRRRRRGPGGLPARQLAASGTTSAATTVRATTIPTARQVDRTRTLVDAALGAPALTAVAP